MRRLSLAKIKAGRQGCLIFLMTDETKILKVAVTKDDEPFLNGNFEVTPDNYITVKDLLTEVDMTRAQAASMLSGYMHARDVGPVTEDMGKIALIATVFFLEAGETDIVIPLGEQKSEPS